MKLSIFKQTRVRLSLICSLIFILFSSFSVVHKYYVSITQIDYVKEQKSLQIISRIFIDDIEDIFRERYDESIVLDIEKESEMVEFYFERYLKEKINIKVNGKECELTYLGKEYENDIVFCYLEIESIKTINSFEISNTILFDKFEEQKNIVRLKIDEKTNSFILTNENQLGMLNFD